LEKNTTRSQIEEAFPFKIEEILFSNDIHEEDILDDVKVTMKIFKYVKII